jgi:hypothetical protein
VIARFRTAKSGCGQLQDHEAEIADTLQTPILNIARQCAEKSRLPVRRSGARARLPRDYRAMAGMKAALRLATYSFVKTGHAVATARNIVAIERTHVASLSDFATPSRDLIRTF